MRWRRTASNDQRLSGFISTYIRGRGRGSVVEIILEPGTGYAGRAVETMTSSTLNLALALMLCPNTSLSSCPPHENISSVREKLVNEPSADDRTS